MPYADPGKQKAWKKRAAKSRYHADPDFRRRRRLSSQKANKNRYDTDSQFRSEKIKSSAKRVQMVRNTKKAERIAARIARLQRVKLFSELFVRQAQHGIIIKERGGSNGMV